MTKGQEGRGGGRGRTRQTGAPCFRRCKQTGPGSAHLSQGGAGPPASTRQPPRALAAIGNDEASVLLDNPRELSLPDFNLGAEGGRGYGGCVGGVTLTFGADDTKQG